MQNGYELIYHAVHPGSREDDLLATIVPDDKSAAGFRTVPGPIVRAARRSKRVKIILLLDEWDKSRASCDAFMLGFLQDGAITHPGFRCQARLDNLVCVLTMNYERTLSEPLLRRLPVISFPMPTPDVVEQALRDTHGDSPWLERCVGLYTATVAANLPKPATIQELRQLIDALEHTKSDEGVPFDSLVQQFVTKDAEDHRQVCNLLATGRHRIADYFHKTPAAAQINLEHLDQLTVTSAARFREPTYVPVPNASATVRVSPARSVSNKEYNRFRQVIGYSDKVRDELYRFGAAESWELVELEGSEKWFFARNDDTPLSEWIKYEQLFEAIGANKIRGTVSFIETEATREDIVEYVDETWNATTAADNEEYLIDFVKTATSRKLKSKDVTLWWRKGKGLRVFGPVTSATLSKMVKDLYDEWWTEWAGANGSEPAGAIAKRIWARENESKLSRT